MAKANFFHIFGFYSFPHFLEASLCETIRSEIRSSQLKEAGIRKKDGTFGVNEGFRSAKWGKVSAQSSSQVKERLQNFQPILQEHFHVPLSSFEEPQFLIYRPGDFYRQHADHSSDAEAADYVKRRRVSIVVFLSSQNDQPLESAYGGGSLTFYGLIADPRMQNRGMAVDGEEGLLFAFPSHHLHEVTPVTRGERFTIVTWYYAADAETKL